MSLPEVLRIRAFRNLWLGQAISQIGDALYYVSFLFMVQKVTGSAAMVGYTGAVEALPYLLVMPYSGVLADRVDRKRIMLVSDLLCAALLLGFGFPILAGMKPAIWEILLLAFTLSSVRCFFMPAKSAAIPALVPESQLMAANAVSMSTFTMMQIVGLAFSAMLLAPLYNLSQSSFFFWIVTINAATFLGSAFFVARLPKVLPDRTKIHEVHPMTDLKEGITYVRRRHDLSVLIILLVVFRISVAPFMVTYVVANNLWWGGPSHQGKPATLAIVELTFFVGWLIGNLAIAKFKPVRPTQWFMWAVANLGLMIFLMAFSPEIWLFCIWNFLAGLALPAADIPINTYMMLSVEDAYRGRTSATVQIVSSVAAPVGTAAGGLLVSRFGLVAMFAGMGIGMVVSALMGFVDREFRQVTMPAPATALPPPAETNLALEI